MSFLRRGLVVAAGVSMIVSALPPANARPASRSPSTPTPCTGVAVTPAMNLQLKLNSSPAGTTFCLGPGTYRIPATVTVRPGHRLIGAGEPGSVVISGARIVTATWAAPRWVVSGQQTLGQSRFTGTSEQCRPIGSVDPKGMCVYKDQVFLDGVSLWQVPTLADLSAGEFFWNYATNKIYLVDNPTGRTLEVSKVGGRALVGGAGVVIDNLVVEKFGNSLQSGAVSASTNWTISNSEFRLNHAAGVHMGPGTVLLNNHIHHNGQLGIHGGQPACSKAAGMVAEGNEISFNNAAAYNWGWEGGASKWNNTTGLVLRGNWVHDNVGHGLWTDGINANVLVEGNVVEDNAGMGINHELGQAALIRDNEVRRNGFGHPMQGDAFGAGIFIDQSRDVEVYGNVVQDNAAGIVAVQEPAGSYCGYLEAEVVNLSVHDNVVRQPAGIATGLRLLNEPDQSYYDPARNNHFEGNAYQLADPVGGQHFKWRMILVDGRWRDTYTVPEWVGFGHDETGTFGSL